MKKIAAVIIMVGCISLLSGCGLQQQVSHLKSDLVGLERSIELYANDGSKIKEWQGRYKVEVTGNSARFMHKGKAVNIAGTFVIEEL